ncbi:MAG: lipocalin family protein [Bacteroidales bacterium]|nr:lipocalin family protein [Bacteroidales bacterium]
MKKLLYLAFCLVAMVVSFTSCNKEKQEPGTQTNETDYSKMIVGKWNVDGLKINGEVAQVQGVIHITMNEDGTGIVSDNGVTENNNFTWSVKGDKLTIVQAHGEGVFTIIKITANEVTFTGKSIPGQEGDMGEVEVHITRI